MLVVWLGVLLFILGLLYMAAQAIWGGRLSIARRSGSAPGGDTLEPNRPAGGFDLKANWPGLALVALGAILMLSRAAF
jgi:hypothetical protein